eukprot:CAMPEP_0114289742 /NCGR_PEP_ID=MMETSP0059-20121206/7545_1 /TAXON_ID=36894 /ORGANISM="Pyramimonas parkeae, Strain CCMP726" /LENGTH=692 /DNA_ID=CAMNT_0001411053 /DNA_START=295 /DNA_END=2373 /DNA_ORIENTATION=-
MQTATEASRGPVSARRGWDDSSVHSDSSSRAGSSHHGRQFYLSMSHDNSMMVGENSSSSPNRVHHSESNSGRSSPFSSKRGACNFNGVSSSQDSPIDILKETSEGASALKDSASNLPTMQPLVNSTMPPAQRPASIEAPHERIPLEQTRQTERERLPPLFKSSDRPPLDPTLLPQNGAGRLSSSPSFQCSVGAAHFRSPQQLQFQTPARVPDRDRRTTDDSALSCSPTVLSYEAIEDSGMDVMQSVLSIDTVQSSRSSMSSNLQSLQKTKTIVLSSETVVWIASTGQQLRLSEPEDLTLFQDSHGTTPYPTVNTPGSRDRKMISTNYLKLHTLGRGSFGKVSLYEDQDTQQLFAIKRFKKLQLQKKRMGPSSNGLDVCMNEVNIHKQIQGHPNIVSLHKVFDDHGVQFLYMVLEHMANGHVHPPPPSLELPSTPHVERVQKIVYDVLNGLQYLHERGCVHGDIKPDNIVLSDRNIAKISDFGSAQMVQSTSGMCSHAFGTPSFTAPECLHKDTYNGYAADMWALGISVHLMIHGSLPYANLHKSISELHSLIMGDELDMQEIGDAQADDFLHSLLIADPNSRMTAEQALKHPWMLAMYERRATSAPSASNSPMPHTIGNLLQLNQNASENGPRSPHSGSKGPCWYARFNRTVGSTKSSLQRHNSYNDSMSPVSPGTPTGVNTGHTKMVHTVE